VQVQGKDEIAYLTAQFNESAARIEALVGAHKTLLANASHELRSPLARLRMGLELLREAPSDGLHAEMRRSIAELDQLIEEILLASRLDAANPSQRPSHEPIDMLGLLAEECASVGATLDASPDAHGADPIQGDAKLLRRLVRNLLENAKRYGGQGEITAQWLTGKPHVLRISDNGPGVPAAERERIFEPFYRSSGASEASGGVGLGLALVKTIATHHQASVRCTNRPDGKPGACFEVRF
jgi:signal transduction histidine kinase